MGTSGVHALEARELRVGERELAGGSVLRRSGDPLERAGEEAKRTDLGLEGSLCDGGLLAVIPGVFAVQSRDLRLGLATDSSSRDIQRSRNPGFFIRGDETSL